MDYRPDDTIVALSTAHGAAAIAVIRMSGTESFTIASSFFYSRSMKRKDLAKSAAHSAVFGVIMHDGHPVDEVIVTLFRAPNSYTGEHSVEISCHGSLYIQQRILQLCLDAGARMAAPGEFTMRAFMNGKLDLSQAEAVADLIASNSALSHRVAMSQMRGGFSARITQLREKLVNFASLIELELDFSEEDVEFADRSSLLSLVASIRMVINDLLKSFEVGNVIKNGVPVAIVGRPNAGKSTLLNVLLEDERAIVSEIPGTTRDTIEDVISIGGVLFRFIDTAGLRETTDTIEQIGVSRAYETIKRASVIIYLFDAHELTSGELAAETEKLRPLMKDAKLIVTANKTDIENEKDLRQEFSDHQDILFISARAHKNIAELKERLLTSFDLGLAGASETIVTNARHAAALKNAEGSLERVEKGLKDNIPGDLLAFEIRAALQELGNITGQVTNEHLLENIFTRFCIGK
jgi:tRNA modification GTPase